MPEFICRIFLIRKICSLFFSPFFASECSMNFLIKVTEIQAKVEKIFFYLLTSENFV